MKENIKKIILLLITFIFLYFIFINLDIDKLFKIIKSFDLKFIFILAFFVICSQICRGLCFKQLISKTVNVPLKKIVPLCLTGAALNIVLPARAGDLFRAFYIGQKYDTNKVKILGSILFERIFDVFVIFCLLLIGVFVYHRNKIAINLCIFAGICMFIGVFICFITYKYNKTDKLCEYIIKKTKNYPFASFIQKITGFTNNICNSFFNGFEIIELPKKIFTALIYSIGIWTFECLCFLTTIHAFGYNLHWSVSIFIISFIALACMIPSTSIFIGPYQAAVIAAFAIYNVNKEAALAISFVEQAIVTITTVLCAFLFFLKNNISFKEIKEDIKKD